MKTFFYAVVFFMAMSGLVCAQKTGEQVYAERRIIQLEAEIIPLQKQENDLSAKQANLEKLAAAKRSAGQSDTGEQKQISSIRSQLKEVARKRAEVKLKITQEQMKLPGGPLAAEASRKNKNTTTQAPLSKTQEQLERERLAAEAAKEQQRLKLIEANKKAVEFQTKRAEEGSAQAQYDLGMRYFNGDGVEVDIEKAVSWLRKAAEQGHTGAKQKMSSFFMQYDRPNPAPTNAPKSP